jgi:ribosome maturation protein Sdo1
MDDGSFYVSLELPAGLMEDFMSEINNSCHGGVEIKIGKEKK